MSMMETKDMDMQARWIVSNLGGRKIIGADWLRWGMGWAMILYFEDHTAVRVRSEHDEGFVFEWPAS